jgi:hypothetical protein
MATPSFKDKKMPKKFDGKSTKLGYGGRAAILKSKLEASGKSASYAGAIVGKIAREKGAAPGQPNYHGK